MRNCRLKQFMTNNYDFLLWVFATGYTVFAALILTQVDNLAAQVATF